MSPGDFLNVHFEESPVGSGWRCVLVLTVGRKWTRLFYPPTCDVIRVPNGVRLKAEPVELRKRKLAARIRDNARENVTANVKEALALVRAA